MRFIDWVFVGAIVTLCISMTGEIEKLRKEVKTLHALIDAGGVRKR